MKRQILTLGIGTVASEIVYSVSQKVQKSNISAFCCIMDTDNRTFEKLGNIPHVSLAKDETLSDMVSKMSPSVFSRLFGCDAETFNSGYVSKIKMNCGASMWRSKALLMLEDFLADEERKQELLKIVDEAIGNEELDEIELYVVASLAGGTGSALFAPVSLYLKDYILKKTGKSAAVKAVLLSSDIYEGILSAEQKVKADANCYAALRELNAMNMATVYKDNPEMLLKNSISFSLDSGKNGGLGTLFVADCEKGNVEGKFPFDKVYYFERIPGVSAFSTQTERVCDILFSLLGDDQLRAFESGMAKADDGDMFSFSSMTRVLVPKNAICEYIGRKILNKKAYSEAVFLYEKVKADVVSNAKMVNRGVINADVDYREKTANLAEKLLGFESSDMKLGVFVGETEPNLDFLDYWNDVVSAVNQLIDSNDKKFICKTIEKIRTEEITAKTLKKAKGNMFTLAEQCKDRFFAIFTGAISAFEANQKQLVKKLEIRGNKLSLADRIIVQGSNVDNPVFAYVRLCYLANHIDTFLKEYCGNDISEISIKDIKEVPEEYFVVNPPQKDVKGKYASSDDRFKRLLAQDKTVLGKKDSDFMAFADDICQILEKIQTSVLYIYAKAILPKVNEYIARYVSLFEDLLDNREAAEIDLSASRVRQSTCSGITQYLFSSPSEKENFYNIYSEKLSDKELPDHVGNVFCKRFAECVITNNKPAYIEDFIDSVVAESGRNIAESEFGKHSFGDNTLDALLKCRNNPQSRDRIMSAFFSAQSTVKTLVTDTESGVDDSTTYTGVIISEKTPAAGVDKDLAKDQIIEMFGEISEVPTTISFVDYMPEDAVYVYREKLGMDIDELAFVNESQGAVGFVAQYKCLRMGEKQRSPLWNPYISYESAKSIALPFISSKSRKSRLTAISKALLCGIVCDKVYVADMEDGEKAVYHYFGDNGIAPVMFENATIKAGDYQTLINWLKNEVELVKEWSDDYDEAVKGEIMEMPFAGDGNLALKQIETYIMSLGFITKVAKLSIPVAGKSGVFAEPLLATVSETLLKYTVARFDEESDECYSLYKYLEEHICSFADKKDVESVNAKKYFCDLGKKLFSQIENAD